MRLKDGLLDEDEDHEEEGAADDVAARRAAAVTVDADVDDDDVDAGELFGLLGDDGADAPAPRPSRKRAHAADDSARPRPRSGSGAARGGGVVVAPSEQCAFCIRTGVDTQLMPCGHLFHGQCLRPWLEATVTTPVCPLCSVAIANCVLASAPAAKSSGFA